MSLFLSILLCIATLVLIAIGYRMGQAIGEDFVRFLRMYHPDRERLHSLNAYGRQRLAMNQGTRRAGYDPGVMDLRHVSFRPWEVHALPVPSLLSMGQALVGIDHAKPGSDRTAYHVMRGRECVGSFDSLAEAMAHHNAHTSASTAMHKAWEGSTLHFSDRNSGPHSKRGEDPQGGGADSA